MGKHWRIALLVGLGLLVLAAAVWLRLGDTLQTGGEQTFDGKSSSQWRAELRAELAAPNKEAQPVSVSLMRGGTAAVPVLIDLLDDDEVQVRRLAAYFLGLQFSGKAGPEADLAISPLTARLRDDDAMVRRRAVEALGYLGPRARPALPGIVPLLKDPEERIAWEAAWALGNMGPDAQPAVPALREARKDPRTLIQKGAVNALEKIDPGDVQAP